jgi:hypothetical protein
MRIVSILSNLKVYFTRSIGYLTIANTLMILFLSVSRLQDYGLEIELRTWLIPLFVTIIIGMFLVGYIDDKAGFHKEELNIITSRNPYFKKILDRLDDIEKKEK